MEHRSNTDKQISSLVGVSSVANLGHECSEFVEQGRPVAAAVEVAQHVPLKVAERDGGMALIIFAQASAPVQPAEGSLHHPATRQEHESSDPHGTQYGLQDPPACWATTPDAEASDLFLLVVPQ